MICQHIPSKMLARLEKIEEGFIEQFSRQLVIDTALLIGDLRQNCLLQHCRSNKRYLLCQQYATTYSPTQHVCVGKFTALPYAQKSIDLVILPHVLEFSKQPQIILQEIVECLSDRGTVFLFAFSPTHQLFTQSQKNSSYTNLSVHKTKQLLLDAGLEIKKTHSFFSLLSSFSEATWLQGIDQIIAPYLPFLCHAYFIIAQKITVTSSLIPLKSYRQQPLTLALETNFTSQQESP